MILWLDHLIFGDGLGLRSPSFDNTFFWLVDSHTLKGELYTFSPGYGAQLRSTQWTHPKPGDRRRLCNRDFVAFGSHRRRGRVEVSWSWAHLPNNIDEANAALRKLRQELGAV